MVQLSLLFSSLISWGNLELNQYYLTTAELILSPKITLNKGTAVEFVDQIPLDQIRVQLFEFRLKVCPTDLENQTTEMIILNGTYGIELAPKCKVSVYLENRDLYQPSFFSEN